MKSFIVASAIFMATAGAAAQDSHAGHDHAGHDHGAEHAHGEHHDIGTTTVANVKLEAAQLGKLTEKEGIFEITLAKGTPQPKAVRVWVGVESAEGSVKAKAEGSNGVYEVHVEMPNPMPKNAKMWVEIQPAEGKKAKASFELKK